MTEQEPDTELPQDVRRVLDGARMVIAATDDGSDPAYAVARRVAVAVALAAGAGLVLIDHSAESDWVDPYPDGAGSVDSGMPRGETALTAQDALSLGRGYLADQVDAARTAGVDASGWIAPRPGLAGLAIAVDRFRPQLAVVPSTIRQRTLRERIRTHFQTVNAEEFHRTAGEIPLLLVAPDGTVSVA